MTTETAAKRDTQKLQRAIVDGLEDVKAQDIQVFDTEHLSPLFERVIVASGTSNRQTKALAASVVDAVREAGFAKPRVEGEGNGEWIIVDCSQAVVHIMQPAFRTYYHLEELWGDKPVRLKFGATKPPVAATPAKVAGSAGKTTKGSAPKAPVHAGKAPAKKAAVKLAAEPPSAASTSSKAPAKAAVAKKAASAPAARKAASRPAAGAPARSAAKTAAKAPAKSTPRTAAAKAPAAARQPAARKTTPRA